MATDETRLVVSLEARIAQFERSMARATGASQRAASGIQTNFRRIEGQALSLGRTFAGAFGLGILTGGLAGLTLAIQRTVSEAAGLVDLADKIGITTDALQELRFQADQNGSSAEALDGALEQFSRRIGLAATGTGELLKILQANGVALRDNEGNLRPLNDLLGAYADLIKNAANDQDRAVLATEAFGRAGDEMANVLRGGSAEIEQFKQRAHELNQVVGEEGVRNLEAFDDRLQVLSGRWDKFWTDAVVAALGALEQIGRAEHAIADQIADMIDAGVGNVERIGAAAGRLAAGQQPAPSAPNSAGRRVDEAFANLQFPRSTPNRTTVLPSRAPADTSAAKAQADAMRALERAQDAQLQALEAGIKASQDRLQEFGAIGQSVFSGLVSSITSGATAAEALSGSLKGLLDQLANLAINSLFGALFGGGLSAGAGALGRSGFAGLFAGGGTLGAGQWGIAGERGPEIIHGPASVTPMGQQLVRVLVETNDPLFTAHIDRRATPVAQREVGRGLASYDRGKQREQLRAG